MTARVVVVDDSLTMRKWLSAVLNSDSRLQVIGEAADAHEARAVIKAKSPDVITLDIEMPRMSGLDFLERLMRLRPMPVVMISSQTSEGSAAAIQALSIGAMDCIWKPNNPRDMDMHQVCESVYIASNAAVQQTARHVTPIGFSPDLHGRQHLGDDDQVILIGASTGGVGALEVFLSGLPQFAPPVVIAQHMPQHFLESFIRRLGRMLPHDVGLAEDGMVLQRGQVRFAPSQGLQTAVKFGAAGWRVRLEKAERDLVFEPSVEHLFASAEQHAERVVALIMTGLGNDGAGAMRRLRDRGATTLGQSESSCVVYGMPRAAFEAGAVMQETDIEHMADRMISMVQHKRKVM